MDRLNEEELLTKYYDEILNIMNTIKVGVFITDGQGNVLMVNKESERTGGLELEFSERTCRNCWNRDMWMSLLYLKPWKPRMSIA